MQPKEGTMAEKTEGQPVFEIADGKPLERTMFLNAIAYGLETGYFREDSQRVNDYAGRSATFLRALAHQHQEVDVEGAGRFEQLAQRFDKLRELQSLLDLADSIQPATSPSEQGGEEAE